MIENLKETNRGFTYREFEDANGHKCNMQISSAIREECLLWLGCQEDHVSLFKPGVDWQKITLKELENKLNVECVLVHDRMHLTQSQVKEMLPFLTKFAETGEI